MGHSKEITSHHVNKALVEIRDQNEINSTHLIDDHFFTSSLM